MTLLKIKDFDPDYRDAFGGYDVKGLDVYSDINNEKIGSVQDLLVDEQGHFRYFIVDLGFWAFGKKVLLPIERSQVDSQGKHVYAIGLAKDQVEALPEFNDSLKIDNDSNRHLGQEIHRHSPAAPAETVPPASVRPLEQTRPLEQMPPARQVPPAVPQQPYPDPVQPVQGYPTAAPPQSYPAPQPPLYPSEQVVAPAQAGYPPTAPGVQQSYPTTREANGQNHSLQRFEERLRNKRVNPPR